MRRAMFALCVVLLTLIPVTVAGQALPPHKFYGSSSSGSPALLNGVAAGDGATVIAINQRGQAVGRGVVTNGTWAVDVDSLRARTVYFVIGASSGSGLYDVTSGGFTEVALSLSWSGSTGTIAIRPGWEQYTVQQGDTLLAIAERYELMLEEVMERNPQIGNAHNIQSGQVIFLRELQPTDVPPAPVEEAAPERPVAPASTHPDLASMLPPIFPPDIRPDTTAPAATEGGGTSPTLLLIGGLVALLAGSFAAWWWRASRRNVESQETGAPKEVPIKIADPLEDEPVWHVEDRTGISASFPRETSVADSVDAQLD